jgi:hypothetical protein
MISARRRYWPEAMQEGIGIDCSPRALIWGLSVVRRGEEEGVDVLGRLRPIVLLGIVSPVVRNGGRWLTSCICKTRFRDLEPSTT